MIVHLPPVKATGRREGWWFRVDEMAKEPQAGLRQFEGVRLAAGTCELFSLAVVLLLRPIGSASSNKRAVDVMYADPSGELKGIEFGLSWGNPGGDTDLCDCVRKALYRRDLLRSTEAKLHDATQGFVGQTITPESRAKLAKSITDVVQECLPPVMDANVEIDPNGEGVVLSFKLPVKGCRRVIRCAVPVYGPDGSPDFCFVSISVPFDYVNTDEDDESAESHHHKAARKAALDMGYAGITADTPVYDSEEGLWTPLLGLFDWDSSSIYDLDGKVVRQ